MSRHYQLLVFDWDGTLMDSTAHIARCLQRACEDAGLQPPDLEACRQVIGLGLAEALQSLVPHLPAPEHPKLAGRYRHHYFAGDGHPPLFAGAREMLVRLKERGFQLAIATGKARRGLDAALEHADIGSVFDATRCADESHSKPHPAMLLELMDELMAEPSATLMIGDTSHDMLMASNAGVAGLGIGHGAHEAKALHASGALAVTSSIEELEQWLQSHG